jgi:hypothetical protein
MRRHAPKWFNYIFLLEIKEGEGRGGEGRGENGIFLEFGVLKCIPYGSFMFPHRVPNGNLSCFEFVPQILPIGS